MATSTPETANTRPSLPINVSVSPARFPLAPNGDLLICTNDTGYVRRVRTACLPATPKWMSAGFLLAQFRIQWVATPGTPYIVERSSDLAVGSWTVVAVPTASGPVAEFLDQASHGVSSRFYRVSPPR